MTALRLVLGDAVATALLVAWLAAVLLIGAALGEMAGDPGHVEADDWKMEDGRHGSQ